MKPHTLTFKKGGMMRIMIGILTLFGFLFPLQWRIEEIEGTRDFLFLCEEMCIDSLNHPHFLAQSSEGLAHFYYDGRKWHKEMMNTPHGGSCSEMRWDSFIHPHIIYSLLYYPDSSKMNYAFWNGKEWIIRTVEKRDENPFLLSFDEVSLDLDSKAYPHILYNIWVEPDFLDSIKYAKWNGREWEREEIMARRETYWIANRLIGGALKLDSSGRLHFLYRDSLNLYYAIKDNTGLKSFLVDIPDTMGPGGRIRVPGVDYNGYDFKAYLELDKKGYLHIGYKMFSGPFPLSKIKTGYDKLYIDVIKYAYWDGGKWRIQPVDSIIAFVPEWKYKVRDYIFKWDSKGYPHIVYGSFDTDDTSLIYYIKWDGNHWLKDSIYDPQKTYEKFGFSFTLDRNDLPHIVFCDWRTKSLFYARYVSEGIEDREKISNATLKISPNPVKCVINIRYSIKDKSKVILQVYDVSGKLVKTLTRVKNQAPGVYTIKWYGKEENGEILPSGVYFIKLEAKGITRIEKVILMR